MPDNPRAQIAENFERVRHHLDGLMAGQVIGLADTETMLLLAKILADHVGLKEIDGLPIFDWYNREKFRRLDALMLNLEDASPGLAAAIQYRIDDARRKGGLDTEPT